MKVDPGVVATLVTFLTGGGVITLFTQLLRARTTIKTGALSSTRAVVKDLVEARNEAETVLNATAKGIADEQYANLSDEEKAEIGAASKHLREVMRGNDHQATRQAIDRLSNATMRLAELIMNSAIAKALKDKRVREIQ